jgi:hypothetical protein
MHIGGRTPVSVSEERLAYIRELSNDERVDRTDTSAFSDDDWDRFNADLDAETLTFCRENKDPEELHAFADTWNWDAGPGALQDLLENPACEAATALLIYWKAAPEFYRQFSDRDAVAAAKVDVEAFDFATGIEIRYVAGDFPIGRLSFDPNRPDDCGGYKYVGAYDDLKSQFVRELPAVMYAPVFGHGQ